MSQDKVTRLRQLLGEATPTIAEPSYRPQAQAEEWRRFQHLQIYQAPAPLECNSRAVAIREITRIAGWYGWTAEIQRVLDQHSVRFLAGLTPAALNHLDTRMRDLEDCIQQGLGAPDAPPAM
jgi:hypothetical protein